jgi:hypothetical protein
VHVPIIPGQPRGEGESPERNFLRNNIVFFLMDRRRSIDPPLVILPRKIKQARIAWYQGKILSELANDYWQTEIEIENRELALGVFVPESIMVTSNALVYSDTFAKKFIEGFHASNALLLGSPLNEIGTSVKVDEKSIKLDWKIVEPEAYVLHFSLEEPQGVDRFYDTRTGTVKINSSIENSLNLDLDSYQKGDSPLEKNSENVILPNQMTWSLWFLLAVLCAMGIWLTRRKSS